MWGWWVYDMTRGGVDPLPPPKPRRLFPHLVNNTHLPNPPHQKPTPKPDRLFPPLPNKQQPIFPTKSTQQPPPLQAAVTREYGEWLRGPVLSYYLLEALTPDLAAPLLAQGNVRGYVFLCIRVCMCPFLSMCGYFVCGVHAAF